MKFSTLLAIITLSSTALFTSCRSEYDERLEEAKELRNRLTLVENRYYMAPSEDLKEEMQSLEHEIRTLAKVSGNEEMFLSEIQFQ